MSDSFNEIAYDRTEKALIDINFQYQSTLFLRLCLSYFSFSINSTKRRKRYSESCGPGADSG
jgi:hypothetical protein